MESSTPATTAVAAPASERKSNKRPASGLNSKLARGDEQQGSDCPAKATGEPENRSKKRRSFKKVPKQHRVGNFRSYYNYRLGQHHEAVAAESDPRLSVLQRDWFANKRGLDVGCNAGNLTIAIAKTFAPSYYMGVDVDPQLVAQARGNLKEIMQKQQVEDAFHAISTHEGEAPTKSEAETKSAQDKDAKSTSAASPQDVDATIELEQGAQTTAKQADHTTDSDSGTNAFGDEMPLSFRLWKPPQPAKDKTPKALGKAALSTSFPYNVVFKREDVAKDTHAGKDYDFITCFSVTKWIHLFHGDDGLKQVFRRFYELLAPGGRLILEPQPWKSYHKRKFTSEVTIANYAKIELRPKDFAAFLTESVGFKSCTFLQVCQTSSKGFKRPIYVVEK